MLGIQCHWMHSTKEHIKSAEEDMTTSPENKLENMQHVWSQSQPSEAQNEQVKIMLDTTILTQNESNNSDRTFAKMRYL